MRGNICNVSFNILREYYIRPDLLFWLMRERERETWVIYLHGSEREHC